MTKYQYISIYIHIRDRFVVLYVVRWTCYYTCKFLADVWLSLLITATVTHKHCDKIITT